MSGIVRAVVRFVGSYPVLFSFCAMVFVFCAAGALLADNNLCWKCSTLHAAGEPYATCAERECEKCVTECCSKQADRCCCLHVDKCSCEPPPQPMNAEPARDDGSRSAASAATKESEDGRQ